MKKKLSCLLAAALLLAGLAGCGEKQQTATESYIAPAVLTDGEKDLLGLLDVTPIGFLSVSWGKMWTG